MDSGYLLALLKRQVIAGDPPEVPGERMASVAIVLSRDGSLKTLMIKRADRKRDPWSGQVAFPGGRMEPEDESILDTAIRETKEEVGIDLARSARYMGHLGTFKTHTGTMLVAPCVFILGRKKRVMPNQEVASYRWIPVEAFFRERSRSTYHLERGGVRERLPAYVYRDYVIWGLTHRMISFLIGKGESPIQPR